MTSRHICIACMSHVSTMLKSDRSIFGECHPSEDNEKPADLDQLSFLLTTNVQKSQTLDALQKCQDKQGRPRSDCF